MRTGDNASGSYEGRMKPGFSFWRFALKKLRRSPVGITGVIIVIGVILTAAFAPWLAPWDPAKQMYDRVLLPPAWMKGGYPEHLLGTDNLGRDQLSRIIYGSRISVMVGVSAVAVAGAIGIGIGLLAGYGGGVIDMVVSRIIDTFLAIPYLVLVLAIIGVLGPNVVTLVVVMGLTSWVTYARVVRGEVIALREREFVEAARAIGVPTLRIAIRHVLPQVMGTVIVLATLNVATTILSESSLSFLGLGVQPPTVTWGAMLSTGRAYITTAWWLATFPGLTITIVVLGIIFFGDWLRDVLDPKLK